MRERREIPPVETKTTKDLLQLIAGKAGMGSTIIDAPKIEDGSAEAEAKAELERRINVIFESSLILKECNPRFENFARHETSGVFMVDVLLDNSVYKNEGYLEKILQRCYFVNSAVLTGPHKYRVSFDIKNFENRLVQNQEPAGIYVNEAPLTIDQITRLRLHWANLQFDKVVQPQVGTGTSTSFKKIEEVDGELRIYADTATRKGEELVFQHVKAKSPLGFHINWGDAMPESGFYLRISFADFKKLLPSTVVDEERAGVSERVGEATK